MDAVESLYRHALDAARRPRPEATYRVQFHAGFTFRDAAELVPYLRDLGVTHLYASPYLHARPGSTHGYDVVNHRALNPEVGSPQDYDALVEALRRAGMGQILDVVPNHAGVATNDNGWWNDVLENGPASRYAAFFDVAWRSSPRAELQNTVLLPVLGTPYGEALESGQLRLALDGGAFFVHYYDRRFPVAPRSYELVLDRRLDELERLLGPESPDLIEYQSILTSVRHLPDRRETDPARVTERQREKEVVKRRLADLCARCEAVLAFVEENVAAFHGKPGDPHSFDAFDELLGRQCFRLSFWRVASDEINYRRFFDVNDLAALSMERPEVFAATHELVLGLLAEGKLDGLRIDHPDGLFDPAGYLRRLQRAYLLALARRAFDGSPEQWKEIEPVLGDRFDADLGPGRWPLYVAVEKILGPYEPLPAEWAVCGTSGYDFVNVVNGLFVDKSGEGPLSRFYREVIDGKGRFLDVAYESKRLILRTALASELHVLASQLDRLAQKGRHSRDFTLRGLTDALTEVIACFPVYRGYVAHGVVRDADRKYVETATRRARARNPLLSRSLLRFVRRMLVLDYPENFSEEDREEQRHFAGKFQQVTSPVMAKGVEDTAFYVFNRLVSLNEVGGEPVAFGRSADDLHRFNADRQARWPFALSPLSTHDTKRSEDARARIDVLSELPEEWASAVRRWSAMNAAHRRDVDEAPAPDANEEYLVYQTLIGAWPLGEMDGAGRAEFVRRLQEYFIKALHEAKVHSSWVNPNAEYDQAVTDFVARLVDPATGRAFLDDFLPFQARVSHYGMLNSLSQTLLKATCPGVPDTYQGTESWDFSLVDPDNRRPVDYARRRSMLAALDEAGPRRELASSLIASKEDGRVKLYVNAMALRARRERPGLFSSGEYLPLGVEGGKAAHVFAFARQSEGRRAVVAVPRLTAKLTPGEGLPLGEAVWGDTRVALPDAGEGRRWRDAFTGEEVADGGVGRLFGCFPVALLLA